MSLKVWLPLDGDLRNLGCSNYTITTIEATPTYAEGKIGQCYQRATTDATFTNGISIDNNLLNILGATASIALWVKPLGTHTHYEGAFISSGNWNTKRWAFGVSQDNSQVDVLCGSDQQYINCTVPINEWTHLVSIFNNGTCTLYKNGIYIGELTGKAAFDSSATNTCIGRETYASGYFGFNGLINDVRIYDHCLSAAEVHEIAQGLVLHYKLEGPMGGSGINLLQGANKIGDSNSYGWIKNGSGYSDFTIEKLENNILHYKGTISNSKYVPTITTKTVAPCEFSKTYTYQMELKFDKDVILTSNTPMHFWAGCRNTDDITNVNCNGNLTGITYSYVQNHSGTLTANTWVKIITRITFPSAATTTGYDYPAIRAFVYGAVLPEAYTGEVNVWMRNCKIEEGAAATNWSIAPEDIGIDITKVQDSSGYNHNGWLINGTTQTSSPRYSTCIQLNGEAATISGHNTITGAQYLFGNLPLPASSALTVSWWGKNITYDRGGIFETTSQIFTATTGMNGTDYNTTAISNWDATFRVYNGSSNFNFFNYFVKDGNWHYHTIVFDGTKAYYYCDGLLKTSGVLTGTLPAFNGIRMGLGRAGGVYRQINEMISDLRIYVTPLLDTDIKLLYNTSSRIDNLGGIHSFALSENQSNIFRSELIMPTAKAGYTERIGEIVEHNGYYAMNIAPAPFYHNLSSELSGILQGQFLPNTSYIFDLWIDVDSVISGGENRTGGLIIKFTDGTQDGSYSIIGGNKGWQHKKIITPSNKTIDRLEIYYYTSTDVFYRLDSYICPVSSTKITKQGILNTNNIIENSEIASIYKGGSIYSSNFIEM